MATFLLVPSPAQLEAIQAESGPTLVLAGPGAGKTFCLIERIRFLIDHRGIVPERICALTFTNKAAEEVATRLKRDLGEHRADAVTRSTIHSLCVRILRTHGAALELERGFGIADEEYQASVLGKLGVPAKWRAGLLNRFGLHRLGLAELHDRDGAVFRRYREYLARRRMIDFDDLTHLTVALFARRPDVARAVASAWDCLLVDEAQDLNHVQYAIVRTLGAHRHVFLVGDDEQSIFSWTGADPDLIKAFANDFGVTRTIVLDENRRTAREIFELARRLVSGNRTLFTEKRIVAHRTTPHPVIAIGFGDDRAELAWLLEDLRRDQAESGLRWGDFAVLYRKHQVGDALEGALTQAGIPCRLAQGRAVGDDPVVRYLLAALRVIAFAGDPVVNEQFVRQVLPHSLCDTVRKEAEREKIGFMPLLRRRSRELGYADEDGRKIRRALYALQNLAALGARHETLGALVEEILSQRVGPYRTALEDRAEELTDPAGSPAAVRLAAALERVRDARGRVLIRPLGGVEIGLAGLLAAAGIRLVDYLGGDRPPPGPDDLVLGPEWAGPAGLALTTFKALQLLTARGRDAFRDFVVVDLETTDRDVATAEIVEIAAVRVRNWEVVAEFQRLVKPRVPIAPGAARTHGYTEADVAGAPHFEDVWPEFAAFLGDDVMVAHNGYEFDFPILSRMVREAGLARPGGHEFVTYDTLPLARWLRVGSARLEHLAERFGIDPGESHKAIWDVRTLARVFRKLEEEKLARSRRVALAGALDHLGVSLALSEPETLDDEGRLLRDVTAWYALGRFSSCLDFYRAERERVGPAAATVEELIERLGGQARLERVRTERRPDQRYPSAMARVRRLLEGIDEPDLQGQIREFLGRVALSRSDGPEAERERVNLLTLHSTKGLEFSRVYIVGVEDAEMPGGPSGRAPSLAEVEEARRLLYVGMTRARDRLVLTRVEARDGRPTGGHRFLDEMGIVPAGAGLPPATPAAAG